MVRCSNESADGAKHDDYPLVVVVLGPESAGSDGALCKTCLARAYEARPAPVAAAPETGPPLPSPE